MSIASPSGVNVSLYQAAAAMNANSRWQETISQNLASSSIPGFKKQEVSFSAFEAGLMAASPSASRFLLPQAQNATSFRAGELKPTGVTTDVALEGDGFFEVRLPDGSSAYTRDGEFHVDSQDRLVTKQGHLVMGESGPVQLDHGNPGQLGVSASGEISQGTDLKGKLKLVTFDQPELLTPINSGYFFANNPGLQPRDSTGTTVRQGYIEGANTSPVAEMASLITVMRAFEANQKIIQMQDERMGRTIAELGNPT